MAKWRKTMSRGGLGSVALLACSCGGDGSHGWNDNEEWAEPDVSTHRDEIRGGDVITGATGVVDFFRYAGENTTAPSAACTGSMIGPNVVLTAAHCFDALGAKTTSGGTNPFTVRYYDPDGGIRVVFSGSAEWSVIATYDGAESGAGDANDDFGIIQVPTRFTDTDYHDYLRIYGDVGSALERLELFGAGRYSYSGATDNNLRREDFDVENVEDWHITLDTRDGTSTCSGDSGGPWVYNTSLLGVSVPLIAGVHSQSDHDGSWPDPEDEGDVCANNDAPHDNAYASRTRGPRIDWVEDQTDVECHGFTDAGKNYRRCFELPFVEDVEYEGLERGLAVGIVMSVL